MNQNLAINRDTGDISLSPIYDSLILKDSINIFTRKNLKEPICISNENRNCRPAKTIARQRILAQSSW